MMRAQCKYVSLLDYRIGARYSRSLTVDADGEPIATAAKDDWGLRALGEDARPKTNDSALTAVSPVAGFA